MKESPAQTDRPGWPRPPGSGFHGRWNGEHWVGIQDERARWGKEPFRRDLDNGLAGGVTAGIAARIAARRGGGDHVTAVRVVLVVITLISGGFFVPVYLLAWLLIPAKDAEESIAAQARRDTRGITLALGLASLLAVLLVLVGSVNSSLTGWGWNQVVSVGCLALIWRNAPPREQETLRRLIEPLSGISGGTATRRITAGRIIGGAVLVVAGLGWLLGSHASLALLRPLAGMVLVAAGLVLLLGPWWFRIARDLVVERQARARAEERAEVAARVHDSVLQTLALIQRRSEDPAAVVSLARAQERELRSWLFEGRDPGTATSDTLSGAVREIQQEAEARHGVPVEVVTVGDCPLNEHLNAQLAAAREAVVNAAKWSGAPVISVFAEVSPGHIEVVVRDRGAGFDASAVAADRRGISESIRGRMTRHGGTADIQSAPGEGTKVTLTMPRQAVTEKAEASK